MSRRIPQRRPLQRPIGMTATILEKLTDTTYVIDLGSRVSQHSYGYYIGSVTLTPGTRVLVTWREESRLYHIVGPQNDANTLVISKIGTGPDDGHWSTGTEATFDDNGTELKLLETGTGATHNWLRFALPILQGRRVVSAFIRYKLATGVAAVVMDANIRADDEDDAPNPTNSADADTRYGTGIVTVNWSDTITASAGDTIDSSDITGVIQAILDRAGWAKDNYITLYVVALAAMDATGFEFKSFDHVDSTPPELHIELTTAGSGGSTVHTGQVHPDIPGAASTLDDEFDGGGSLDAKWTITNDPAGADAVSLSDYQGFLHIGLLELGTDNFDNLVRAHQSPPPGDGAWEIVMKAAITATGMATNLGEFAGAYIYLGNSAEDEFVASGTQINDSPADVAATVEGTIDDGGGGISSMSPNVTQHGLAVGQLMYLKLVKETANAYTASNDYSARASANGITWWEIAREAKTFTTAPDEIGIFFRRPKSQIGTPKAEGLVQWFRRDPTLVVA